LESRFVERVVILILKTMGTFYYYSPRRVQLFLGNLLGRTLFLIRLRKKIVDLNLETAFPGDRNFHKKLARDFYKHLGNLAFEVLLVPKLGKSESRLKHFVKEVAVFEGVENLHAAKQLGRGVIYLASHLGNWEIMAAIAGVFAHDDLMLVTKTLKPSWLHRAIESGRLDYDVKATYEPRTLKDVLSHLRKNGSVGFVLDQYVGPPVGVRVPFFGKPVGTSLAVAMIAKRTGAPVLPVENFRRKDGRWIVKIHPPLPWKEHSDHHHELALNTAEYSQELEKHIRRHPEQWLWIHRRFKGSLLPLREGEWEDPRPRQ